MARAISSPVFYYFRRNLLYKTQEAGGPSQILSLKKKKHLTAESTIPTEESTIDTPESARTIPTASYNQVNRPPQLATARVSAVPVYLRPSGPFGPFMVGAGPCAQGYSDCVGIAPCWIIV